MPVSGEMEGKGNDMKIIITWSDGQTTITDQASIDRFIALYGQPKFKYAVMV